jgi:methionine biosynthesis protein MetW
MKGRNQVIEEYYENAEKIEREEFKPIIKWIKSNTKVLDVGCGVGSLGQSLTKEKNCEVWGVDVSNNAIRKAEEKGVKTSICDIDLGLKFNNDYFDYVILCDILEHVYRPRFVLEEALCVAAGSVIVASPNVAYWIARLQLLLGRFPRAPLFGYEWYNTPHIHLFSYRDFKDLVRSFGGGAS